jgi:glycosyltransferase involved in cell wall biosynthesis
MAKRIPHIQVDAFPIVDTHFSGVGHYTAGIASVFDQLADEGKITYSLIVPSGGWRHRIGRNDSLAHYQKVIVNPLGNKGMRGIIKYNLKLPVNLLLGKGAYYFPSFLAWPLFRAKSVTVIHDVTFLAVPECVERGNREFLERVVPHSIKNSSHIIAVSEFSKSEIMKYYGVSSKKISVAHPSIDRKHFYKRSTQEIHKVKAKYDIFSENYILSVGNIEPRKNYDRLIDAYTALPRDITDKYPLVIVGAGGWNNKRILEKIQRAKENGYWIINPKQFVHDEDMPALYSGAHCYVFTPIYEGFGMSPLEAYACGTPVLASNVASVPEAAGDAAVYVDPYSVDDISQKLEALITELESNPTSYDSKINDHLKSLNWRESGEITASALTGKPRSYFKEV